ncbi:DUF1642 domain-containing protein [Lactiplantibacillus plantarum]|nr:DUF1642 domain-containing protein [Lactiplantibacillus plantarum]MCG0567646.1 putative prophage protein [Lactiplantibacillus plantarum]MCG0614011.1 putative prophage protein [Lactiplantibacillus plantarum]MCG0709743.1 putative prophage protein [Lactiplantibacillus plantarum]UTV82913.1 DUF1642 domain-containing protein [Lactiplantibacillus plantarum]
MKVYLKQPFQAEQFAGSNEMIDKYELIDAGTMLGTHHSPELYLTGSGKVDVGDWIATGVNGEHWAVTGDVFKKTYAELPVIPKNVTCSIKQYKEWNCDLGIVFDDACSGNIWKAGVGEWILEHSETFARAWLDGYVVEEEHD